MEKLPYFTPYFINGICFCNTSLMTHVGQNIAKLRGMRRLTQKEMAAKLNLGQPDYSKIEQRAEVDDKMLALIADVLQITPDAIKNFNEEAAINIISNTLNDNASVINNYPYYNLNPVEKLMEVVNDNKKMAAEIKEIYERLLKEKDEIILLLKRQLKID